MPGGRHRSSLRDLGLSGANSPNPYKHGSAKRVVRVLGRFAGQELPWPPDREKKFWNRLLYLGLLEPAGERSTSAGGDEL